MQGYATRNAQHATPLGMHSTQRPTPTLRSALTAEAEDDARPCAARATARKRRQTGLLRTPGRSRSRLAGIPWVAPNHRCPRAPPHRARSAYVRKARTQRRLVCWWRRAASAVQCQGWAAKRRTDGVVGASDDWGIRHAWSFMPGRISVVPPSSPPGTVRRSQRRAPPPASMAWQPTEARWPWHGRASVASHQENRIDPRRRLQCRPKQRPCSVHMPCSARNPCGSLTGKGGTEYPPMRGSPCRPTRSTARRARPPSPSPSSSPAAATHRAPCCTYVAWLATRRAGRARDRNGTGGILRQRCRWPRSACTCGRTCPCVRVR